MKTKIKEAISVFIAIAFISVAAGGDYYYSEMQRTHGCHPFQQRAKLTSTRAEKATSVSVVNHTSKKSL